VLPTLLGMPVNLLSIVIEGIQLLGNILPLIPRIRMLPEYPKAYFYSSTNILSSSSDHPCKVILCRFRDSHLNRQESAEVPGMREEINCQLYQWLWTSPTATASLWQCLHINQMRIFKSQTLQLRFSLRVLVILARKGCTSQCASRSRAGRSRILRYGRLPPRSRAAIIPRPEWADREVLPTTPRTSSNAQACSLTPIRNPHPALQTLIPYKLCCIFFPPRAILCPVR
jgi:hypothetical protein